VNEAEIETGNEPEIKSREQERPCWPGPSSRELACKMKVAANEPESGSPEQERHKLICQMKMVNAKAARQCEHIKTNGEFCASPALRGRNYCYFHLTQIGRRLRQQAQVSIQRQDANPSASSGRALGHEGESQVSVQRRDANLGHEPVAALELPPLEDGNSIQIALMQVIDAILQNRLDSKRAGLVLYALQTASSNLANGARFEQMRGATVAGRYEDFEQDFELGDAAPELKVEETAEEDGHAAKIAQIEEQAAAYAKLDAAETEADERRTPTEEDGDAEPRASYPCGMESQFFCSLNGPLARARAGGPEPRERIQRDVASQRIELVPHPRPKGEGDKAA